MGTRSFLPQELIRRKRDGEELEAEDINAFVRGLTDGSVSEGQIAAFAMAVHFRGMTLEECTALTQAMTLSGRRLSWREAGLDGPVLDKHSTGGVGDKVSLVLAPLLAACGGYVPMISGRGLGHTGGTLDKLGSIPGYTITPPEETLRATVASCGCAIVGQTGDLAPADDRFYAIRDVTATVDPTPLITASILSKKLAAGLDALIMDVKFGSGAFSRNLAEAAELGESIAMVASGSGLPTDALLTDMSQVLGFSAGNAVEVAEAVRFLTGEARDPRLEELTFALATELMMMGKLAEDAEGARQRLRTALDDGSAAERFGRMVAALGGPADFVENAEAHRPRSPVVLPIHADEPGIVQRMDVRAIGMAVVDLGGGRRLPADEVDPSVGLTEVLGIGAQADPDRPLALVHAATQDDAERAARTVADAITLGDEAVEAHAIVRARLGAVRR